MAPGYFRWIDHCSCCWLGVIFRQYERAYGTRVYENCHVPVVYGAPYIRGCIHASWGSSTSKPQELEAMLNQRVAPAEQVNPSDVGQRKEDE